MMILFRLMLMQAMAASLSPITENRVYDDVLSFGSVIEQALRFFVCQIILYVVNFDADCFVSFTLTSLAF